MEHQATNIVTVEADKRIGAVGQVEWSGVSFDVRVEATRRRYGHTDLLIRPVSGDGSRWVECNKVAFAAAQ